MRAIRLVCVPEGAEQRGLEAQQLRRVLLQRVDGGSSPNTSSMSGAACMAARNVAWVGWVTVSLRKSGMGSLS